MEQSELDGLRGRVAADKKKPGQYGFGRGVVEQLLEHIAGITSSAAEVLRGLDTLRRNNETLGLKIVLLEAALKDEQARREAEVEALIEENAVLVASNLDFQPKPKPPKPPKQVAPNCGHCSHGWTCLIPTLCRRNPWFSLHLRWSKCGEWRVR